MSHNNPCLIIAQSCRALAHSAKLAGIDTHAIDLFADQDTREDTRSSYMLNNFSIDQDRLIRLVRDYVAKEPKLRIIIGSGFEDQPNILRQLQQISPNFGNHYDTVKQVKHPPTLAKSLQTLLLPYPEYHANSASVSQGIFLIKIAGKYGGSHVQIYKPGMVIPKQAYLQRFVTGRNYSATFIANGISCYLLGFNETWTRSKNIDFTFAGAASNAFLPARLCHQITNAIKRLVTLFKLKGLCGLDFIVQNTGRYAILEINPRPTATFELYQDQSNNLFKQHIAALSGQLIKPEIAVRQTTLSKALAILYASKNMVMPHIQWPEWVTDKPDHGKLIARDMPICTVHATGSNIARAKQKLMNRLDEQRQLLGLSPIAI